MKNLRTTFQLLAMVALAAPLWVTGPALAGTASSALRATGPAPLAVVTGTLPAAASRSAPARVYVFGEPSEAHTRVGQSVAEPVLATGLVAQGSAFRLGIPDSAVARALLSSGAGSINVRMGVVSERGVSSWFAPVSARQPGTAAAAPVATVGRLPAYDLGALRRSAAASGLTVADLIAGRTGPNCIHDCVQCSWRDAQNKYNVWTRVDELHAATNVTATYTYQFQADSTFTLGYQAAGESGWKVDGTYGVTNDTGIGASVPERGYYSHYFNATYDYHKDVMYAPNGFVCIFAGSHKQEAVAWDGSIGPGGKAPDRHGGATCHGALEIVTIPGNNSSNWKQSGHSVFWSAGVSSPMGFSFGDRTGYSSNTKELWVNHSGGRSYLCGPGNDASRFASWPIVYNYNSK